MKKVYLGLFAVAFSASAFGQVATSFFSAKNQNVVAAKSNGNFEKAEGDEIWSNNFSSNADWEMGTLPGHSGAGWAIRTTLPAALAQIFPSFTTVSGGNFAIMDSDGAGGAAAQNAWIGNQAPIAVADILTDLGESTDASILLTFTEIYRRFLENYFVEVSNDNGATWTTFAVNEVGTNTNSLNPEYERLNITAAIGTGSWSNEVKIRFRYQGAWDWFWAIDDVKLTVAPVNDVAMTHVYQSANMNNGYEYYTVPVSQTSFPGFDFGAKIYNAGSAEQDVTLNVSTTGYNENSSSVTVATGSVDTISLTTAYSLPAAVGNYTLNAALTIPGTDANPSDNTKSITVRRDNYIYTRDNGTINGSVSQISTQDSQPLWIGNEMTIFNEMQVSSIHVRLTNQPAAVDQMIDARIEILSADSTSYSLLAETEPYTIESSDLSTFVKLNIVDGPVTLSAGSTVLVMAHHYGGANEVQFGTAQATFEGSVIGRTADNSLFTLLSPRAVMIRLDSEPSSVGIETVNELKGVKVYPNPSTGVINISNDLNVNNTIIVTDLAGKIVSSKEAATATTIDLTTFGTGMYMVEISNINGKKVEKVVIK